MTSYRGEPTQPTTAAGRALLIDLVEHVEALAPKESKSMHDATAKAILAIEAEARQQDDSGLRAAAQEYFDRTPLTGNPDELPPERREFATAFWKARHALAAILAALPPSAPPALDVDERPCQTDCCDAQERRHIHVSAAEYARLEPER